RGTQNSWLFDGLARAPRDGCSLTTPRVAAAEPAKAPWTLDRSWPADQARTAARWRFPPPWGTATARDRHRTPVGRSCACFGTDHPGVLPGSDISPARPAHPRADPGALRSVDQVAVLLRFVGEIAGVGTTSGTRVVVGRWEDSPFGPFGDAMVETADGHRVL